MPHLRHFWEQKRALERKRSQVDTLKLKKYHHHGDDFSKNPNKGR